MTTDRQRRHLLAPACFTCCLFIFVTVAVRAQGRVAAAGCDYGRLNRHGMLAGGVGDWRMPRAKRCITYVVDASCVHCCYVSEGGCRGDVSVSSSQYWPHNLVYEDPMRRDCVMHGFQNYVTPVIRPQLHKMPRCIEKRCQAELDSIRNRSCGTTPLTSDA